MKSVAAVVLLLMSGLVSAASIRPNKTITPGDINPAVTQSNIADTICKTGWTATQRPDKYYSINIKRKQIKQYKYRDTAPAHYEEDHFISLELGGSNAPANLWPERLAGKCGALIKDRIEDRLHKLVCNGTITLDQAQKEISTDWVKSYRDHIGPLVCRK